MSDTTVPLTAKKTPDSYGTFLSTDQHDKNEKQVTIFGNDVDLEGTPTSAMADFKPNATKTTTRKRFWVPLVCRSIVWALTGGMCQNLRRTYGVNFVAGFVLQVLSSVGLIFVLWLFGLDE